MQTGGNEERGRSASKRGSLNNEKKSLVKSGSLKSLKKSTAKDTSLSQKRESGTKEKPKDALEELYKQQINITNPLGYRGNLVSPFADLIKEMWTKKNTVVPRRFKYRLGDLNHQFRGYGQQDSQEFLGFLVDGLHEELNLRKEKPYIQNPESENREDFDLSTHFLSNSLRRNWSFVRFLFTGQMRSALECQVCNKVSITYDEFSSLPLSLPEPAFSIIELTLLRLPQQLKEVLLGKLAQTNEQSIEAGHPDDLQAPMLEARQLSVEPEALRKMSVKLRRLGTEQPTAIRIRVKKDADVGEILEQIRLIPELDILQADSKHAELILMSLQRNLVRAVFDPKTRV